MTSVERLAQAVSGLSLYSVMSFVLFVLIFATIISLALCALHKVLGKYRARQLFFGVLGFACFDIKTNVWILHNSAVILGAAFFAFAGEIRGAALSEKERKKILWED